MSESKKPQRFTLSTLLTVALLVGFLGFGFGIKYPELKSRLSNNQTGLPANLDYASLEEVYDKLKDNFGAGQLDSAKLLEGAKRGLVEAAGDPYTLFLNAEEAEQLQDDLNGTFSGIGAEVAKKNERIVIVAPLSGSPAEAAGLRAGDIVAQIDGESTEGMSVDQAVSKIRGPEGSDVTLTIVRGSEEPKDYVIKRQVINVPAVKSELKSGGIGYIELTRFDETATAQFIQAANDLKAQGATKFVVDLRNNPGGLLDGAVDVSDEFLDAGSVIVEEKKEDKVVETFRSTRNGALLGVSTVVLINEGSASASEIVAGALQDNQVATIVGTKSFGKGSVQEIVELGGNTYLKVTVAQWYTPNGRNITKEGIQPDVTVELSRDDFNANRDPQLDKAIEILNQ